MEEKIYPEVIDLLKKPIINSVWVQNWEISGVVGGPYINAPSSLPLKIDLSKANWVDSIRSKKNPHLENKWINKGEPIISHVGYGLIIARAGPIHINNKINGAVVTSIKIKKIQEIFLSDSNTMVIILSKETFLIGSSEKCRESIKLIIPRYDYLEQLTNNPDSSDIYKLTNENQPPDLRLLANRIKTESEFFINIQNNKYFIYVKKISDPDLKIIGLLKY